MFVDEVNIQVTAGCGGDGCMAFRREKYIPMGGPYGGNGGRGGDVIFVADSGLKTLIDLKYQRHIKGNSGENGEGKNKNGKSVGIDWNCRDEDFIVMSNGTKVKCPRFLQRSSKQLNHQQKIMSKRFVKGLETQSSNYYKQKQKVALLYEKVSNQRKDWLHKLSRQVCNEYETIVVEDINLQTMSKMNHGKVIGDQGFGMLQNMIAYKGNLVKVNPKNTSKTCHCCGYINPNVKVGVNYWECPNCRAKHDRDINAALNILHKWNTTSQSIVGEGTAESINACGVPNGATKQETSQPSITFRQ